MDTLLSKDTANFWYGNGISEKKFLDNQRVIHISFSNVSKSLIVNKEFSAGITR